MHAHAITALSQVPSFTAGLTQDFRGLPTSQCSYDSPKLPFMTEISAVSYANYHFSFFTSTSCVFLSLMESPNRMKAMWKIYLVDDSQRLDPPTGAHWSPAVIGDQAGNTIGPTFHTSHQTWQVCHQPPPKGPLCRLVRP